MSITLRRPIYNPKLLVPGTDVAIEIPSIKTVLAESEYQFITSMAGDNFSEPLKVPQAAQWLQQYYTTDTTVLSPEEPLAEADTATSEEAGAGASPPSKQELFKQAVKAEEGQPQKPPPQVANQLAVSMLAQLLMTCSLHNVAVPMQQSTCNRVPESRLTCQVLPDVICY